MSDTLNEPRQVHYLTDFIRIAAFAVINVLAVAIKGDNMSEPATIGLLAFGVSVLGLVLSRRIGFSSGVGIPLSLRTIGIAAAIGIAVGLSFILLDTLCFWSVLPSQLRSVQNALPLRIAHTAIVAMQEDMIWRLFTVSLLIVILSHLVSKNRRPTKSIIISAITISATIYIIYHLPFLTSRGIALTPVVLLRQFVLYFSTPFIWGLVYWRYGIEASMVAHAAAHIPIEIGLSLMTS